MEDLAEIEASYYRAITSAKVSDITTTAELLPLYSKNTFQDWVKRLDIYDLDKDRADFFLDDAIVTTFTDYRNKVAAELSKNIEYDSIKLKGQLKNIGSCQDGTKVGKMNETDSLYVIDADIRVENIGKDNAFRIFSTHTKSCCEIKPRSMQKLFADAYADVISQLRLPDCLNHAGYQSPDYSGVRYNGPAATSQFLTEDDSLLSWDMTPAFCLDTGDIKNQEVRRIIQPALGRNRHTCFGHIGIHLIPDTNEDLWKLSTAQMEADMLRELIPRSSPVRQALSRCKVIANKLRKWNSNKLTPAEILDCGMKITKELDAYLESPEKQRGQRLNQVLRYAHIWIPPETRRLYKEDEKAHVSINTAAIKHILLAAALENPEAFAEEKNEELVLQLMVLVFKTLWDKAQFSSPHAFLKGTRIPHISVLSSQAPNKLALALSVKEQCRMLVSGAMTKVSQICRYFYYWVQCF